MPVGAHLASSLLGLASWPRQSQGCACESAWSASRLALDPWELQQLWLRASVLLSPMEGVEKSEPASLWRHTGTGGETMAPAAPFHGEEEGFFP